MAAEKIKPHQLSKPNPANYRKKSKSATIRTLIQTGCQNVNALSKATDTDPALASRILKQYKIESNQLSEYKLKRADIMAGMQHKLLASIGEDDIKKAPLGSRVLAAAQLYDKERLERNQSTANISTAHGITPEMQELYDKITGRAKVEGQTGENQKVEQDSLLITQE
jgi:hypothetical protein